MPYELLDARLEISLPAVEEGARVQFAGRSEERFAVSTPLVVCGLNSSGRLFFELASVHDISRSGCRVHLRTKPQHDSPLAIRLTGDRSEGRQEIAQLLFQVTWILPEAEGWAVGSQCLGSKDLRTLVFPSQKT